MSAANPNPMEKSIVSVLVVANAGGGVAVAVGCYFFHISLLEPAQPRNEPIPGHIQLPPPPIIIDDEEEWEVEEIIDSRYHRKQLQYRVKWTGFRDEDKTWYPATNFNNSPDTVQ
jgi:hypothetical protein